MSVEYITGREVIIGAKKASGDWRTAEALGAGDGILITGESFGAKAPTMVDDDSLGQADIKNVYRTHEGLTGAGVDGYLRYEGWDVLLALALGTAGVPSQLDGTAYYNTYSPADNINGLFATMAMKKAGTTHGIWEIPSAKIHGFTIRGEVGGLATISFNIMGNKIENYGVSVANQDIDNVTPPTYLHVAKMDSNTALRMNAQGGAALQDTDKIYPFSFEVTYNRPMAEQYEAGYDDMSEPVQDGFAEATIRMRFDKYNLDTFMDAIDQDTEYKMDILLKGLQIGATGHYYQMRINIPLVRWRSGSADVGGPGTIAHEVEGRLLAVDSAPTGMTGVTDPLAIHVINTRTTDPLA